MQWSNVYITDKSGKKFWNTMVDPTGVMSEVRNLTRHLEAIKANHHSHQKVGVDKGSVKLMIDGNEYLSMDDIMNEISDDDLLAELMD